MAVVKLSSSLSVGDKIRVVGGKIDFVQPVKSIEINHKKVKRAIKKQVIGLKLKKKAREGYKIYKV